MCYPTVPDRLRSSRRVVAQFDNVAVRIVEIELPHAVWPGGGPLECNLEPPKMGGGGLEIGHRKGEMAAGREVIMGRRQSSEMDLLPVGQSEPCGGAVFDLAARNRAQLKDPAVESPAGGDVFNVQGYVVELRDNDRG